MKELRKYPSSSGDDVNPNHAIGFYEIAYATGILIASGQVSAIHATDYTDKALFDAKLFLPNLKHEGAER